MGPVRLIIPNIPVIPDLHLTACSTTAALHLCGATLMHVCMPACPPPPPLPPCRSTCCTEQVLPDGAASLCHPSLICLGLVVGLRGLAAPGTASLAPTTPPSPPIAAPLLFAVCGRLSVDVAVRNRPPSPPPLTPSGVMAARSLETMDPAGCWCFYFLP